MFANNSANNTLLHRMAWKRRKIIVSIGLAIIIAACLGLNSHIVENIKRAFKVSQQFRTLRKCARGLSAGESRVSNIKGYSVQRNAYVK